MTPHRHGQDMLPETLDWRRWVKGQSIEVVKLQIWCSCPLMAAEVCLSRATVPREHTETVLTILADSVLPAPDSPLIRIACRCSSIIMFVNA